MNSPLQLIALTIIVHVCSPAWSQEGPQVPCVGCENLVHAPFPEAGAWYNPDQPGTGISLEIQNGFLLAYYYGYTAAGLPEWQLISGPLVRSEQDGVQWELDAYLNYFEDGNCIGCDYVMPVGPVIGPAVKLEFLQRNNLRLSIGENPSQYYVPIIYGSLGAKYFEGQTPYVFPKYEGSDSGSEYATHFLFVAKPNTDPPSPWLWESFIMPIGEGKVASGGHNQGKLVYDTWIPQGPPGPDVIVGLIVCELDQASDQPGCKWVRGPKEYVIPIGGISDSRIFGEAEDGSTIEGYRIGYD